MSEQNPEIGQFIQTGEFRTNYHDIGEGEPLLLLHGSGPGVSGWANWRLIVQNLSPRYRVILPDFVGFGFTEYPEGTEFNQEVWLKQAVDFLDALGIEKAHVVGNSFGGSMALALAIHHPERVDKLILMGAVGVPFEITEGLDRVWGYEASLDNMRSIMKDVFAYDSSLITEDLVQMRYQASTRPGMQEAFSAMFPAPRQRWVDSMAHPEEAIRALPHRTLMVHGRDDKVIPLSTSMTMLDWIDDSQLHVYSRCGHWTQIEKAGDFSRLVDDFLSH